MSRSVDRCRNGRIVSKPAVPAPSRRRASLDKMRPSIRPKWQNREFAGNLRNVETDLSVVHRRRGLSFRKIRSKSGDIIVVQDGSTSGKCEYGNTNYACHTRNSETWRSALQLLHCTLLPLLRDGDRYSQNLGPVRQYALVHDARTDFGVCRRRIVVSADPRGLSASAGGSSLRNVRHSPSDLPRLHNGRVRVRQRRCL